MSRLGITYWISRFLALTALICTTGWLALNLALPPGYASPIWPPTGIALAALLIWGRNLWPAIWVGTYSLNLWIGAHAAGNLSAGTLYTAAGEAAGSTLQALVAVWLTLRWVYPGAPKLTEPRTILIFAILTGPLACLIAPSIGTASLLYSDTIPASMVPLVWWNWWVGDTLSAVIIAPIMFCFFARPHKFWRPRRLTVALPLFGMLAVLISIFTFIFRTGESNIQLQFDNVATLIAAAITENVDRTIDASVTVAPAKRSEFAAFTSGILQRNPEIQVLEWIPRITGEQRGHFEQSAQAEGYSDFSIKEHVTGGAIVSATDRKEYFPILFAEPMTGNLQSLGFDLASEPVRRQALEAARTSGKPVVSQRINPLHGEPDIRYRVLVVTPVYDAPRKNQYFDKNLAGFTVAVVRLDRLVETALTEFDWRGLHLTIRDLNAAPETSELYHENGNWNNVFDFKLKVLQKTLTVADHTWQVTIAPDTDFVTRHSAWLPWVTQANGLVLTSILMFYLLTITGRTAHIQTIVTERTASLEAANKQLKIAEKELLASTQKLRGLYELSPLGIALNRMDGKFIEVNDAFRRMTGYSTNELKNLSYWTLTPQKYQAQEHAQLALLAEHGYFGPYEKEYLTCDGQLLSVRMNGMLVKGEDDNDYIWSIVEDITESKRAQDQLKLAARVFTDAREGITISDADGIIIDVNPTFCEITGYSREEAVGQTTHMLKSEEQSPEFYAGMLETLKKQGHWQGELWSHKKNGELYAELLTLSALRDESGQIRYFIGLFSDITPLKQQQQALELLAYHDPLTNLPNRSLFEDRFSQAIARCNRDKALLAICYMDLDGFKQVNDSLGHEAGDQLLIDVAKRITASLREGDTAARLGGDEFALLINIHSKLHCENILSRIHKTLAQPYLIKEQQVVIAASSGITIYPQDSVDNETLLRHADHAMYQAKQSGRNRYMFFDTDQDQQLQGRRELLDSIEDAVTRHELCLYYQPQVNIKTGAIVGMEALIRWRHPERGLLPPMDFLPLIEGSELEYIVGSWVIEEALQQLQRWREEGLDIKMGVNISPRLLHRNTFINQLGQTLAKFPDMPSHWLELEILESSAMDNLQTAKNIVWLCCNALGVQFALDDFGTGYSSLSHLRHLPVSTIKIDQSFVRDMLEDPHDYSIVEGVIGISKAFGHRVVAEGLETEAHGLAFLAMGGIYAQGYGIARPMPPDEVLSWCKTWRPYASWKNFSLK
jgi:diguanylate cyclase (GGDEF)-like protein/PAS domain S-box-containing protein